MKKFLTERPIPLYSGNSVFHRTVKRETQRTEKRDINELWSHRSMVYQKTILDNSINSLYGIQRILNSDINSTVYQYIYSKHKIFHEYKNGLYNLLNNNSPKIIRQPLNYDRMKISNILILKGMKYDLISRYMNLICSNTESINQCIMLGFTIWLGIIPKVMLSIWFYNASQLVDPVELSRIQNLCNDRRLLSFEVRFNEIYIQYCKMMGIECLKPFGDLNDILNIDNSKLKNIPLDSCPKIETSYQYTMKKLFIVCFTLCLFSSTLYQSECINTLMTFGTG